MIAVVAAGGSDWKQIETVDGITVFAREVPNERFYELKLVSTSPLPVEALCDAAYGPSTVESGEPTVVARTVIRESKTPDGSERVTYERVRPPVVSARDFAIRTTKKVSSTGACATSFSIANELAPALPPGMVRIEKLRGGWQFEPSSGSTHMTYTVFTDPGGGVPPAFCHGPMRGTAVQWMKFVVQRAQKNAANKQVASR